LFTEYFQVPTLIFGNGSIGELGKKVRGFNASKILIITDNGVMKAGIAQKISKILEDDGFSVKIYSDVEPEPPIENFEDCFNVAKSGNFDLFIGVGGGSSIDISKAVSVMMNNQGKVQDYFGVKKITRPGYPKIAIPTTSGTGSEVTKIFVLKDKRQELKIGVVSPYNLPDLAIVDPELTVNLPAKITASTGMDALTHAIEAYTALNSTTTTDLFAEKAIRLISNNLRTAVANGNDIEARTNMARGSLYAGIAFANASCTAVHALSFPLGGKYNIPHGIANALMLPYVMEYNLVGNLVKFADIAKFMGENIQGLSLRQAAQGAVKAVKVLAKDIGIPQKLSEVNIPETAIVQLVDGAYSCTRLLVVNPRKMELDDIKQIYEKAI
jgi:alcohol dehydrogenase class IV